GDVDGKTLVAELGDLLSDAVVEQDKVRCGEVPDGPRALAHRHVDSHSTGLRTKDLRGPRFLRGQMTPRLRGREQRGTCPSGGYQPNPRPHPHGAASRNWFTIDGQA